MSDKNENVLGKHVGEKVYLPLDPYAGVVGEVIAITPSGYQPYHDIVTVRYEDGTERNYSAYQLSNVNVSEIEL